MDDPRISLVIPVYNRPEMIATCLLSLVPSLAHLVEVIVVDDGSTDGRTPAAAERTIAAIEAENPLFAGRIRLIRQQNAGPGAARNRGAAAAQGAWVSFLDSDDGWLPWSGAALAAALARHPDTVALFANTRPFVAPEEIDGWAEEPAEDHVFDNFFALDRLRPVIARLGGGYMTLRRDLYQESGGIVPALRGSEDTDLFYRISSAGRILALKAPILIARRTDNADSLTLNMKAVSEGLAFLLAGRRQGRYAAADPLDVDRSLGHTLRFFLREMFAAGHSEEAYRLLLRQGGFGVMQRGGYGKDAWKLLLIPVLSVVRPRNHRFRLRPLR